MFKQSLPSVNRLSFPGPCRLPDWFLLAIACKPNGCLLLLGPLQHEAIYCMFILIVQSNASASVAFCKQPGRRCWEALAIGHPLAQLLQL